jgi:hypothetical protein
LSAGVPVYWLIGPPAELKIAEVFICSATAAGITSVFGRRPIACRIF